MYRLEGISVENCNYSSISLFKKFKDEDLDTLNISLSEKEMSFFIQDLFMGIKRENPVIYADKKNKFFLYSGKQLYSVIMFMQGNFKIKDLNILTGLNGMYYNDLPGMFFNELENFEFKLNIINPGTYEKYREEMLNG